MQRYIYKSPDRVQTTQGVAKLTFLIPSYSKVQHQPVYGADEAEYDLMTPCLWRLKTYIHYNI